jgi:hypothetical protein
MPRGPKGEKRPADAIGNAILIGRIGTGEIEDITTEDGKNAAAVALGAWAARRGPKASRQRSGLRLPRRPLKSVGGVSWVCEAGSLMRNFPSCPGL